MEVEGSTVEEELKFEGFPMKPYPIQIDFMKALYGFLNNGGISLLESPTGTGKTLSMICSALQWLVDKRKQQLSSQRGRNNCDQNGSSSLGSDDEPESLKNFSLDNCSSELKNVGKTKKIVKKSYNDVNKRGFVICNKASENCESKSDEEENIRHKKDEILLSEVGDEEYLLEEYESEGEKEKMKRKASGVCMSSSSDEEEEGFEEKEKEEKKVKIYFCSRTHSQLSQFIKELGKTKFASEIQAICLGSRKVFCINEEVLKLRNSTQINEKCLELQSKKKNVASKVKNLGAAQRVRHNKASSGCPMLRKHKLQRNFRSEVSQKGVLDIEDLVQLGNMIGTCPYFGSRSMAAEADLVLLPYQSLLSKSSRESLGLNLKDNIIIIDEAHNLADSLTSMYDAKITLSQLEHTQYCFGNYLSRFSKLLGSGNRRYIQTLMVLTRAFMKVLGEDISCGSLSLDAEKESGAAKITSTTSMAINDFLFSLNIDNINLFKLISYIKESNIIHKVSGYADKIATSQMCSERNYGRETSEGESSLSSFQALANMLFSLTNNDGDGRIIISQEKQTCHGQQGSYLKYVMLTGEKIFHEIVDQAHAVILAGGTLQPIEEMQERLFPWLPSGKLQLFSCSHIVPPESILPIAVSRGPSGRSFDFSYASRSSSIMIQELGLLLCNLSTVVPEGIVVFFSSFDYEVQVYNSWKASGILERIGKKKRIFREPRRSSDVEALLTEYKKTIDALSSDSQKESLPPYNGAMLLAVVGGKVSEGINFSDGMGRCIVMVGLPYPSPSDVELIERVKFIEGLGDSDLDRTSKILANNHCNNGDIKAGFNILRSCKRRGKEYYENLCMKAVNQSIGRAIRHRNDYAAILLVDARYSSDPSKRSSSHPTNKLPQWIKCRLVSTTHNYGEVHGLLHQFFRTKMKNPK